MVPASTSQIVLLLNRSSGNDVVRCDSSGAGSSAANRFVANFNLGAGEAALCWYSNSASRWMVVGLTGRSEYIRAAPTVLQDVFCLDLPFSTTTVGQIDNQSLPFSNVWRVTPSGGDILLTGIDPASPGLSVTDGRVLFIFNLSTGSDRVTVASEHASSSAANRFTLHATSLDINPRHSAIAVYDGTSSRWRLAALW
jgi:hypothetical protein